MAQFGSAVRLGRKGWGFKSLYPDMAEKFAVGDIVRLNRNINFGTIKIRANRQGNIVKIEKHFFGTDQYWVRWMGTSVDMQMNGCKHFTLAQVSDDVSGVYKG